MYSLRDEYDSRLEGMYNILESSIVVEKFGFRFKKNNVNDKDYSITTINKKITSIKKDIADILTNDEELSKFYKKEIKITSNKDTLEFAELKEDGNYRSGCLFFIVDIFPFKDGEPKIRGNNHPVDKAIVKIEKLTRNLIQSKYPNFKYSGYDGDWDKGNLYLTLK